MAWAWQRRHRRLSFDADVTLRLAGERVIEMLAEAVAAATDELAEGYPTTCGHEPVGMSNVRAHEFPRADLSDLATLLEDVPESHRHRPRSAGWPLSPRPARDLDGYQAGEDPTATAAT